MSKYYLNFVTCKDCDTFVYENEHCFLGKTTLSNGTVITESATAITLYATDKALENHLTPGVKKATYCCVTALKVQENFGTVQLDVNSGISTLISTYLVLKKICPSHTYLIDVLWGQPIKLIQVVSTSEFHEY